MKFYALLAAVVAANESQDFARAIPDLMAKGEFKIENIFKVGAGDITWKQCSDDAGKFTLNAGACTVSPNPIKKGTTETFTIVGSTSAPITVDHLEVDVYYGGSKISSKQQPGGSYTSNVTFKVDSVIPIFAPSGAYTIKATAIGNVNGQGENGSVGCAEGLMNL